MEWIKHLAIQHINRGIVVNNWLQGTYYVYFEGQLIYEDTYVNDQMHGTSRTWHENGQLRSEYNYHRDQLHGIQRQWREDGQLVSEKTFINGVKQN
jgi:antitoxin component YwqK of YwqJK toxin-antitoxin module